MNLRALHTITAEMHGGMLTLAGVCVLVKIVAELYLRVLGGRVPLLDRFARGVSRLVEPTSYVAAIGGSVGLVLSSVTGMGVWPIEALLGSGTVPNKIMFSMFALNLWLIFVAIRTKFGESIWKRTGLAAVYVVVGLLGLTFVVVSRSLAGHLTGKGSILDPLYEQFNIRVDTPLLLESNVAYALVVTTGLLVIAVLYIHSLMAQRRESES